jgi:arsenical pump membrane protein
MCYLSALACNILNNQPMTILFTKILQHPAFVVDPVAAKAAMYGLIMGSNFGANFTIIGALAGIMWVQILQDKSM